MVSLLPQREEAVPSGSNEAWAGEGVASRHVYNTRIYLQSCCCGQEDEVDIS